MNEGIHLDLDTWIVPGQIRKANLCRGLGNSYKPAGTEVLISAVAHNTPPLTSLNRGYIYQGCWDWGGNFIYYYNSNYDKVPMRSPYAFYPGVALR